MLDQEMKDPIRKRLAAELSGDELPEEVAKRARRLVREESGIAAGTAAVGKGRTVRTAARV